MLFHIAEPELWHDARANGSYAAASLTSEGFIHCSSAQQVVATAARYYRGRTGLLLLEIREGGLDIRWEPAPSGEEFPHVYGPIPVSSVIRALPFEPDESGSFTRP